MNEPTRHFVSLKAAIWKDDKLLVVREIEDENGREILNLPGGRIEAGEDLIEGLKREVKEELGVDVNLVDERPVKLWSDIWEHSGKEDPVVVLLYHVQPIGEFQKNYDSENDEDIMEIKYVGVKELQDSAHHVNIPYMIEYIKEHQSL